MRAQMSSACAFEANLVVTYFLIFRMTASFSQISYVSGKSTKTRKLNHYGALCRAIRMHDHAATNYRKKYFRTRKSDKTQGFGSVHAVSSENWSDDFVHVLPSVPKQPWLHMCKEESVSTMTWFQRWSSDVYSNAVSLNQRSFCNCLPSDVEPAKGNRDPPDTMLNHDNAKVLFCTLVQRLFTGSSRQISNNEISQKQL